MTRLSQPVRVVLASLAALAAGLCLPAATLARQSAPSAQASTPATSVADLSGRMWDVSKRGLEERALAGLLASVPGDGSAQPGLAALRGSLAMLESSIAKRENQRAEQTAKVEKELDEALKDDASPLAMSKALKAAVELYLLASDKAAFIREDRVQSLVRHAAAAAREAESKNDWIVASELFIRLNLLLEEDGTYKPDVRRLTDRLSMIQLYAPQRLWELRNTRRLQDKLKPLPPFNDAGEDYKEKIKGISEGTVLAAILRAAEQHVERKTLREILVGGLDSVRTLATTSDLESAFPGIADAKARSEFLAVLDTRIAALLGAKSDPDTFAASNIVRELLASSRATVKIPDGALLHELGNGGFEKLDEHSQIFWPDELPRFKRLLDGEFIGVGIQIVGDEETQLVKVVAPVEGTPAFRAGIKAGDLIKKIDGRSALGMNLNQAIELITGRPNTKVTLTMERKGEDLEFDLTRARIPIRTVRGWRRDGPREDQWDWFVDPVQRIGYVRISGFQDSTTRELKEALGQMKAKGLQGLILDLRFNGGGLLTQAVSVVNLFIDKGLIVYTEAAGGARTDEQRASPSGRFVGDVPVAVLVNEGSASASEIVSGALRYYADQGQLNCRIIGARTYGKGSVQNVMTLSPTSIMKLTVAYYFLPDGRVIHRRDHATKWGVEPHMRVEMLPQQITEALTIRQDADTPLAFEGLEPGKDGKPAKTPPDPAKLLDDGIDLQLQTALVLLQSQAAARMEARAK